ncbi:MAG TPA: hypothetical protein PKD91_09685 [Bacteroidia bacterium]|nr:hypothetical protein [Bacteroidia bacterium]
MNQKLKQKISDYLLRKEIRKGNRKTEVIPFESAKSIGILYDATEDKDYELIKNYVRDMRALSKDVIALGYYNRKELPNTRFMKLGLDFFTQKSLNWKSKPIHPIVTNFMNREFDILISLNLDNGIPLQYVSSMTQAKFKIGRFDRNNYSIFDFMIKVEANTTLKQMIGQVDHYLNLIKNEKFQEA